MDQKSPDPRPRSFLFGAGSSSELLRLGSILRKETVGGALLVVAAIIALVWANSPLSAGYFQLRDIRVGYEPWHLELSLGEWASDGLLAVFFFLVGLELKREFLIGDLREPGKSVVPVAAAAGGVAVPAIIYSVVNVASPETLRGWAIPTATDIAFAVAVLALIGSHLPGALRIFLLTLAVVDDLIAIGIIAVFYSHDIRPEPLLVVLLALSSYTLLAHRYRRFFGTRGAAWLILLPLGAAAWVLVHNSGIHATVAGVMLGFAVPLAHSKSGRDPGGGLAEILEHGLRPVSAGIAVPVFAFFAAGVQVGGRDGIGSLFANPVAVGIIIALVVGKPVGILGTVWLLTKATRARLDRSIKWIDIFGVSLLGGIASRFPCWSRSSASATATTMVIRRRQGSWRRPSSPHCWPLRSCCPGTGTTDRPACPGLPARPARAPESLRNLLHELSDATGLAPTAAKLPPTCHGNPLQQIMEGPTASATS